MISSFLFSFFFFSVAANAAMAGMRVRDAPIDPNAASEVRGVIVITRNGDREAYVQDSKTYKGSATETTALGEVRFPPSGLDSGLDS